eukprot:6350069-Amphidinium_carterae.1
MACPRRTAVTKDEAAVWPLLPALKFKSSGPDVRASVLLAQRSARSAMVLNPESAKAACT